MSTYKPDKWLILKITNNEDKSKHYRVFGTWNGGYLDPDSWRLNSGITKIEERKSDYVLHGESGSIYYCNKLSYGTTTYGRAILNNFLNNGSSVGMVTELDEIKAKEYLRKKRDLLNEKK